MLVNNVEKSKSFKEDFFKTQNAEGTVITVMTEISFKYLITSAVCVIVLELLSLFVLLNLFGLHGVELV